MRYWPPNPDIILRQWALIEFKAAVLSKAEYIATYFPKGFTDINQVKALTRPELMGDPVSVIVWLSVPDNVGRYPERYRRTEWETETHRFFYGTPREWLDSFGLIASQSGKTITLVDGMVWKETTNELFVEGKRVEDTRCM